MLISGPVRLYNNNKQKSVETNEYFSQKITNTIVERKITTWGPLGNNKAEGSTATKDSCLRFFILELIQTCISRWSPKHCFDSLLIIIFEGFGLNFLPYIRP